MALTTSTPTTVEPPLFVKRVGVRLPGVQPSEQVRTYFNLAFFGLGDAFLRLLAKPFGGLWWGGRLTGYPDRLEFQPNAPNRQAAKEDLSRQIPVQAISKVGWRFGFVTSIVDIDYDRCRVSFRCYGSRKLAADIESLLNS